MFLFCFMLWVIFALCELLSIKGHIHFFNYGEISGFSLMLFLSTLTILLMPFNMFYRHFRFELIYSFYQTIISPFGYVRFKDFFLGDILTSMTKPLIDVAFIQCYFFTDAWKNPMVSAKC